MCKPACTAWRGLLGLRGFGAGLVALVFLVAVQLAQAVLAVAQDSPSGNRLLDYPDTALDGTSGSEMHISVGYCRQLCSERAGCKGFDYNPSTNLCRLFLGVDSAHESSAMVAGTRDMISGYRDPANMPRGEENANRAIDPERWYLAHYRNIDLWGGDIDSGQSAFSEAQCASRCEDDRRCMAFTYNQEKSWCFLKSSNYSVVQKFDGALAGLYFKAKQEDSRRQLTVHWLTFQSADMPGNDLISYNLRKYDECLNVCENTRGCSGVTWVPKKSKKFCFLKTGYNLFPINDPRLGILSAKLINEMVEPDTVDPVQSRD